MRLAVAAVCAFCLLAMAAQAPAPAPAEPSAPPPQPLPFSHKLHSGKLEIECALCHANADPGESMGLPAVAVCMQCHAGGKNASAAMQKLAAAAKDRRGIPWVRVYQIPAYVFFSHRVHMEAKARCGDCHGRVSERDQLHREGNVSMGGCVNCHRLKSASNDCTTCHEQL